MTKGRHNKPNAAKKPSRNKIDIWSSSERTFIEDDIKKCNCGWITLEPVCE